MPKEVVAQVKTCSQYGPDDWETVTRTLVISPDTTVREVLEWYGAALRVAEKGEFSGPIHIVAAERKRE